MYKKNKRSESVTEAVLKESSIPQSQYPVPDKDKFKKIINTYKNEDEIIGRDKVKTRDLAALAGVDYEFFRKLLNAQKPIESRDCVIAIGIMLKMDETVVDEILAYSNGFVPLNPRDSRDKKLIEIIKEESDNPFGSRKSLADINESLRIEGLPELIIVKSKKKTEKDDLPFEILRTTIKTVTNSDYLMYCCSLSEEYSFQRYTYRSRMELKDNKSGEVYILLLDTRENFDGLIERSLSSKSVRSKQFHNYNNIDDTGAFKDYFIKLRRMVDSEKRKAEDFLNDTKNYGSRFSAAVKDDKIYVFLEEYNYAVPEKEEYYIMEYSNGSYKLSVYKKSQFMRKYLGEKIYRKHYNDSDVSEPRETYQSEEEFEKSNPAAKCPLSKSDLVLRKRAYKKMKETVSEKLQQLQRKEIFITDMSPHIDYEDQVCVYYNLINEFQCEQDTESGDYYPNPSVKEATIEMHNGEKVQLSLDDLKKAFTLGIEDVEQICRIKMKYGDIDAVLK